jgi:hypothetical protein
MKHIIFGALIAGALSALSFVSPASAQATRTWVSGLGDDANPCSRTAPCKTFAGAITKTAAFGEINVIDPGGFGAVTINKSMTIRSEVEAGVLVAGTNAIVVNLPAATDRVQLEGLDIEGLGPSSTSINGVHIIGSGRTIIKRCRINGFNTGNGVNLVGTVNAAVVIINSVITNNIGGVHVAGTSSGSSVPNNAAIVDTTIDTNSSFAVQASGASNTVGILRSLLNNSPKGVELLSGAIAISFGPSNVIGGTNSALTPQAFQ